MLQIVPPSEREHGSQRDAPLAPIDRGGIWAAAVFGVSHRAQLEA